MRQYLVVKSNLGATPAATLLHCAARPQHIASFAGCFCIIIIIATKYPLRERLREVNSKSDINSSRIAEDVQRRGN